MSKTSKQIQQIFAKEIERLAQASAAAALDAADLARLSMLVKSYSQYQERDLAPEDEDIELTPEEMEELARGTNPTPEAPAAAGEEDTVGEG